MLLLLIFEIILTKPELQQAVTRHSYSEHPFMYPVTYPAFQLSPPPVVNIGFLQKGPGKDHTPSDVDTEEQVIG